MQDIRQTDQYASYLKSLGWKVITTHGVKYFIRKLPLIGAVMKIQRPEAVNFADIENIARKNNVFQIILEPKEADTKMLKAKGFKLKSDYFTPTKTIQIDLTKDENSLLNSMHYKTRYNIKKLESSDLKITFGRDIKEFADFWQSCALKQRGMYLSQKKEITEVFKAFAKDSIILLVKDGEKLLSGILILFTKKTAYYMFAASSTEGKKIFAPTHAAWNAIKLAKKKNMKLFDFEGIYDDRFPIKSWLGFSRFKKSFGGKEIEYSGCYTKLRFPF